MKKHTIHNIVIASLCLLIIVTVIWIIWGNTALSVSHYTITDDYIPKSFHGFRILQISDLHNAEFGEGNQTLLEQIRAAKPDIIVLTGDLIDSRNTDCNVAIHFSEEAVKIAPIYYIPGNHESRIEEYAMLKDGLLKAGVTILIDEACYVEKGGELIRLIGLNDPDFRSPEEKAAVPEVLGALIDDDTYNILLSHRPEAFDIYVDCGINLAFTGHAHGGQFRLPLIGGIFAPGQGFFPKYDAGLFTEGNTNMIVSRGLGNSRFPFRINNRPEIVIVDLISG